MTEALAISGLVANISMRVDAVDNCRLDEKLQVVNVIPVKRIRKVFRLDCRVSGNGESLQFQLQPYDFMIEGRQRKMDMRLSLFHVHFHR